MQGFIATVSEGFSEPPVLQMVDRVIDERVNREVSRHGGRCGGVTSRIGLEAYT
jgi:hypothetical protein